MLEVLASFISASIMAWLGYYIVKEMTNYTKHEMLWKKGLLIIVFIIISIVLHPIQYTGLYTITIFLLNVLVYKYIFNISLEESIISSSILMFLVLISDTITSIFLRMFLDLSKIRTTLIIIVLSNIIVSIMVILIFNIKPIQKQLKKFYNSIVPKKGINTVIFFILLICEFTLLLHNLGKSSVFQLDYIINIIIILILMIMTYTFIQSKNKYKKLESEYDNLFSYVQNFEDWIEREQLNRHEYKNQLAVLRCLTKEKKVKSKIDEILEDSINIEGQEVTNLKNLPKGGIKGLMYYKSAIAQKQKIKLTTDVSLEKEGILTKLSEKEIRILCKLIGIYFDNAIEAASESRKKCVTIEVYELRDKVSFVFSNTFKRHKNMNDRNKKGVSSKGEGRGNGLYFANKILKDNKWLDSKQEIIDNYYIQQLNVKKKDT